MTNVAQIRRLIVEAQEKGEDTTDLASFAYCYSEGEKRPKNLTQDRLLEG